MSFPERVLGDLYRAFEHSARSERVAALPGFLQNVDPRAKIGGILALILAVSLATSIPAVLAIFAFAVLLSIVSLVPFAMFLARVWTHVFLLAALIAAPAIVITPGRTVATLPLGVTVTEQGLRSAALLVARVETVATLALLLVVTTRWAALLTALRSLRMPATFVMILGMTYRQLFVVLQAASDTFLSARSRKVGRMRRAEARQLVASAGGALLARAIVASQEIHLAMRARGWDGDARILEPLRLRAADWGAFLILAGAAAGAVWLGGSP